MKKLMIAAAIVCATAMSYGAAATWSGAAANIYDGAGDSAAKWSGTAYFFDAGLTSQQTVFNAFAADLANFDASTLTGYAATGSVLSGSMGATANKFDYGEQSSEAGQTKDFFFVLVDGDKMYTSLTATAMIPSSTTASPINWKNQATASLPDSKAQPTVGFVAAGQWAQAVPEPTSGLLLLLGVAGLALKRRRA